MMKTMAAMTAPLFWRKRRRRPARGWTDGSPRPRRARWSAPRGGDRDGSLGGRLPLADVLVLGSRMPCMMSTKRFATMMISDVRTVIPITTEKSRLKTELMKYLPMPGIEKMISMMKVPVMSPSSGAVAVTAGIRVAEHVEPDDLVQQPFRPRRAHVVLLHGLEHGPAHQAREIGHRRVARRRQDHPVVELEEALRPSFVGTRPISAPRSRSAAWRRRSSVTRSRWSRRTSRSSRRSSSAWRSGTPNGIPRTTAQRNARMPSFSDFGKPSLMMSLTERVRCDIEGPSRRSPRP